MLFGIYNYITRMKIDTNLIQWDDSSGEREGVIHGPCQTFMSDPLSVKYRR